MSPSMKQKKQEAKKAKPRRKSTALSTEVVNPPQSTALAPTTSRDLQPANLFKRNLTEYKRNQEILAQFVKEYLTEGEDGKGDYGTITGCGDKKVLFKPGAEKLADLYHFSVKLICTKDHEDFTTKLFNYTYRCELFSPNSGDKSVGVCEASANSFERKLAGMPTNTVRKRAEKRAYVGAVIMATRSSHRFTHDLEEKGAMRPDQNEEVDKLVKQLEDMAAKGGGTNKQLIGWLQRTFGIIEKAEELGPNQLRHAIKLAKITADANATTRGEPNKKGGKDAEKKTT